MNENWPSYDTFKFSKKNIREISKKSAAKNFDYIFFLNYIFQNAVKWSKFNLKSWFAYPQTPHKNLIKMAKSVFWFNKYRDVQRRKCVFNLRGHNTHRGRAWRSLKYFFIFYLDLPESFDTSLNGVIWRY